ncbi:MAG: hypothetical protein L3J54_04270 [Draconibacterium sp.]|nr:hypothetical protein [Draconibacterium sp.]
MKNLEISLLRKKMSSVGIRISDEERQALEQFCRKEQITISDFFRLAMRKMINTQSEK